MEKFTIAYARTSTFMQEKGLESQKRALTEYCQQKGITHFRVFEDEGHSGTKSRRPALDEMMVLVEEGQVESVLVYSFSRMARSTRHLLEVLEKFRQRNVKFVSITEQIQTDSPMGQMLFTLCAAFSELERSLIIERITCGLRNARAKGKVLGRPRTRPSELIMELAGKGYSQARIAELTRVSRASVWREISQAKKSADFSWVD